MRKLSFLFISCIAILALSSCTKENLVKSTSPATNPDPLSVAYSEWTGNETFSWKEGATVTVPNQEANWIIPDLTQELLDRGSTVLVFAKSKDTDEVQQVPLQYVSGSTGNIVDTYDTQIQAGNLLFIHTKIVDGNYVAPTNLNNFALRYIIVTEDSHALGRPAVMDFRSMSYNEVIKTLNIPE